MIKVDWRDSICFIPFSAYDFRRNLLFSKISLFYNGFRLQT